MPIKFYYHPQSPPSCVVWMVLKELEIDYEGILIDVMKDEQKGEAFAKINPKKQVPALVDGDIVLSESRAIAAYLCTKYEKAEKKEKLYPRDPLEQIRFQEILFRDFDNFNTIGRYLNGQEIFAGRSKSVNEHLLPKCENILQEYDNMVAKTPYIFGSHLTFLDFICAHTVSAMAMGGYKDWDKYTNLKKWKETLSKLPYFEECIKKPVEANKMFFSVLMEKGPEVFAEMAKQQQK